MGFLLKSYFETLRLVPQKNELLTSERLHKHVEMILNTLPSDLQSVLQKGAVLTDQDPHHPEEKDTHAKVEVAATSASEASDKNS